MAVRRFPGCMTYLWALFEVGLAPWQLMPRVGLFTVLGLWFLLPRVRRGLLQREPDALLQLPATRPVAAALAILVVALFATNSRYEVKVPTAAGTGQVFDDTGQWRHYGASQRGTRFAPPRRSTPPMSDNWSLHGQAEQAYPESSKAHRFKSMMGSTCVPVETSFWRSIRTAARSAGDMIRKSSLRE